MTSTVSLAGESYPIRMCHWIYWSDSDTNSLRRCYGIRDWSALWHGIRIYLKRFMRYLSRLGVLVISCTWLQISVVEDPAKDTERKVREQVASRPDAPGSAIELLAQDKFPQVRLRVAQRDSLTQKLLETLAMDKDAWVRLAATRSPEAAPELVRDLLAALAKDKNGRVRIAVAEHPAAGADLLEALENDDDREVRKAASARRGTGAGELAESPAAAAAAVDLTTAVRRALERAELAGSGKPSPSPQLEPDDLLRAL